jgi:hypothetical protein
VTVRRSPAHADDGWLRLVGPASIRPLQAIVQAVDPRLDVEIAGSPDEWTAAVVTRAEPAPEPEEVAVTGLSTGATFAFEPRRSLPLTVA